MFDILDQISLDLKVPRKWLEDAVEVAQVSYRVVRIKKQSGGTRTLVNPAVETKMIQRWFLARLLNSLTISPIATAFEPEASIIKNAEPHRFSKYSVRIDISNFFPSIRFTDLLQSMKRAQATLPTWALNSDVCATLRQTCFDKSDRLPVGYPSSPRIANIVMVDLDEKLSFLIASSPEKFGDAVLTRYADDYLFSTSKKGACIKFLREMTKLLDQTESPRLKINSKKTRFMSRESGSTLITGLRIKPSGEVGIHAKYRDHLRLLLKHYQSETLKSEEISKLRGHLSFVQHADPQLFTKLSFKYYEEIAKIRTNVPVENQEPTI